MTQNSRIKRYDTDQIDFIIPFLINQTNDDIPYYLQEQLSHEKKNFLFADQSNKKISIDQLAKIYNVKRQKLRKKNPSQRALEQPTTQRSESKVFLNSVQRKVSKPIPLNKSLKLNKYAQLYSEVKHPPLNLVSSPRGSGAKSLRKYSIKQNTVKTLLREDSPILGIKFKKSNEFLKYNSDFVQGNSTEQSQIQSFRGELRKRMKYMKEKKEWDKMRGINVDSIVNRRCRAFQELITQYTRRMQIAEGSRIFIFDSKDTWMKRVLVDNGWVENGNKTSKAFHLYWGNKLYKESLFKEQFVNHYPSSYSITTKTGLHTLLRKYQLSCLQPATFDISSQKDLFVREYEKISFVCLLRKMLSKFTFSDPPANLIQEDIKSFLVLNIQALKNKPKASQNANLFMSVFSSCLSVIQGRFQNGKNSELEYLITAFQIKTEITEAWEQCIRVLRDFQWFVSNHNSIQSYNTIGDANIWITKSKLSSKGVGITLHQDIDSILKFSNRLAQKYMQKPLIFAQKPFCGRKFDVRVWVFVVGNTPRVYYHEEFYGRICYESYSLSQSDIKNQSKHLTNYNRNKDRFTQNKASSESIILPQDIFNSVLKSLRFEYKSKFYIDLQRMLHKLMPIFKNEIARKEDTGCFQLFGFDILIDASLHMHLLEINMSAACRERHPRLTQMLQKMGKGILNILQIGQARQSKKLHGWRQVQ